MDKMNDEVKEITYDAIRIGLASDEKIREWARAGRPGDVTEYEVKKPETINYRTLKPETGGLFCEKIFGPTKKYECHCGKYKKQKVHAKNFICDRCGVEVTDAKVRRERMGYIELAAPVSHIWYFKGVPSRMGLLLDMTPKNLEKVLYFSAYIMLDPGSTPYKKKDILTDVEYMKAEEDFGVGSFKAQMGAEAIRTLLEEIDLDALSEELNEELARSSGQKRTKLIKRLEVVNAFRESGNRPEWMILKCIPVIPPDLRPMVQLDGGRFATSDLNDLYRRIINRNNRLQRLIHLGAPEIIIRNEKRMLQEAVDALNDNGRRGRAVTGPGNRALKSLSDLLKGKQGRFRQNLLGKRVDYSGRSVIVVGPELKIYQCGLPKEMAIELFKPFVMKELIADNKAHNIRAAKKMVERLEDGVWDVLERVIAEHPVMLNRAPTLHRLGIQAFEPILVEGKAIKLHPLVCTAFNADFDGDQMAVHLPLSVEAQAECRFLLLSPNNLLKPSDGGPVAVPSQDMVLGIYYLTMQKPGDKGEGMYFHNENEAILAYENGVVTLHVRIHVRRTGINAEGKQESRTVESTVGRILFNEIISQDLGFVDRTRPENFLKYEIDFLVKKKELKKILQYCINTHGAIKTAETLDAVKAIGYKYSTRAAMTVSVADVTVPSNREQLLRETENKVEQINAAYEQGLVEESERYRNVIETWNATDKIFEKTALSALDPYNNIFMMADSGARGSSSQVKQLIGMRGLFPDTTGKTIELPIKANLRGGLDVLEYFISSHGARKALSDTALRTADSGYLTRRLVDVSQELIIREVDCAADAEEIPGMEVRAFVENATLVNEESDSKNKDIESLQERITGRFSCEDYYDDNGDLIVRKNQMITPNRAERLMATKAIQAAGPEASIRIRTAITCRSHNGICAKCYGANMATGEPVQVGEAVGIIAAQSIGEPGTQLTMRTFHTGGVASDNITQGLPRVEELFEARRPKGLAIVTEIAGQVMMRETSNKNAAIKREAVITNAETGESKAYLIPFDSQPIVKDGQMVIAGQPLTEGPLNPNDILKINGLRAVQDYMLREVQVVYRKQGVEINDKHIEIILHQMLKKIQIEESGDTGLLPGTSVDVQDFEEINERMIAEGKTPAEGRRTILGISKAALATNSFLSAASFQETTKVLTEAAIKGKVDPLIGLKENVILGKLIPAGTGMKEYRNVHLNTDNAPIPSRDRDEEEFGKSFTSQEPMDDFGDDENFNLFGDNSDLSFDEENDDLLPDDDAFDGDIDFPESTDEE
ncbi:MAG: DNA-directed RNA polymerase subunit beta' [Lachnospiraceae bacterium]|nr:DNA-directed RNA polymerase subunit beta' [Lachnospiraceae bacterium]